MIASCSTGFFEYLYLVDMEERTVCWQFYGSADCAFCQIVLKMC